MLKIANAGLAVAVGLTVALTNLIMLSPPSMIFFGLTDIDPNKYL